MVSSHLCALVTPHAARHAAKAAFGSSVDAFVAAPFPSSVVVGVVTGRSSPVVLLLFTRISALFAAAAPRPARNAASRAARTASGTVQRVSLVSRLWKYARPSGATASFQRVVASARSVAVIKHAGFSYVDLPVDALCQYLRRPSGAVCSVHAEAASDADDAIGAPRRSAAEAGTRPRRAPRAPRARRPRADPRSSTRGGRAARPRPAIVTVRLGSARGRLQTQIAFSPSHRGVRHAM